jgi:hypothetical protein
MYSFNEIDYLVRPSKQIERKIFIEILLKLSEFGYLIHKYTYLGFGSIFYADFILFHKYLHIDDMVCVEKAPIPSRMDFNKPYEFIKLYLQPISSVIPLIDRSKKYFVWLDYDTVLTPDVFNDLSSIIQILPKESIIFVTVESDLKGLYREYLNPDLISEYDENEKKENLTVALQKEIGKYLDSEIKKSDLVPSKIPKIFSIALNNFIDSCVLVQKDLSYIKLINFQYKDSTQLITIGGIIDSKNQKQKLEESNFYDFNLLSSGKEQIIINAPPITIREKNYLEKNIDTLRKNCSEKDFSLDIFELDSQVIQTFIQFHRYYPSYYESLI